MMRVTLVCVGRLKVGAERDLAQRYLDRARAAGRSLGLAFDLREFDESRARQPEARKVDEAASIRTACGANCRMLALDETGDCIGSADFAALLAAARDGGIGGVGLVIGGPDGLAQELRSAAFRSIAFGAMTWPHQLVRVMASEQLYRAVTILSGHPYHRA